MSVYESESRCSSILCSRYSLTELIAAWHLAYAIDGQTFTPTLFTLFSHFRQPVPILKGFEVEDNFEQPERSVTMLSEHESDALHAYILEGHVWDNT